MGLVQTTEKVFPAVWCIRPPRKTPDIITHTHTPLRPLPLPGGCFFELFRDSLNGRRRTAGFYDPFYRRPPAVRANFHQFPTESFLEKEYGQLIIFHDEISHVSSVAVIFSYFIVCFYSLTLSLSLDSFSLKSFFSPRVIDFGKCCNVKKISHRKWEKSNWEVERASSKIIIKKKNIFKTWNCRQVAQTSRRKFDGFPCELKMI